MNNPVKTHRTPALMTVMVVLILAVSFFAFSFHHHDDKLDHRDCPACCFLHQSLQAVIFPPPSIPQNPTCGTTVFFHFVGISDFRLIVLSGRSPPSYLL